MNVNRLLLLLLLHLAWASRRNQDDEVLTEWVNSVRWMERGATSFDLMPGDSLSLDCRSMSHMQKLRTAVKLHWRLLDRPLADEGPHGRVHLLESDGRLTVENVNERDAGLYATYTNIQAVRHILKDIAPRRKNDSKAVAATALPIADDPETAEAVQQEEVGSKVAVCMFTVRVQAFRVFTLREGQHFEVSTAAWLAPFAFTLTSLGLHHEEWKLAWYHDSEEEFSCRSLFNCRLNFTVNRELSVGTWSLEMHSLVYAKGQHRVLLELSLSALPQLTYLHAFSLATHQYYMVYSSLMIALCLLSLHLFNNLNWTPFAFDVLPEQVSPRAVLDSAGVFLKESRV